LPHTKRVGLLNRHSAYSVKKTLHKIAKLLNVFSMFCDIRKFKKRKSGMRSPWLLWDSDSDSDSRVRKFRIPDSDSGPKIRLRFRLHVWHNDLCT